jgi:hypothetical protein
MKDRDWELIESCQCGCEAVQIRIFEEEPDEPDICFFSVLSDLYYHNWGWKEKARAIWAIITGHDYWIWEVVLSREQALEIANFIQERINKKAK